MKLLILLLLSFPAHSALIYTGGQLSGVTDINILGSSWSATFNQGSFNDNFTGFDYTDTESKLLMTKLTDELNVSILAIDPINILGCDSVHACVLTMPQEYNVNNGISGWSAAINPKYQVGFKLDYYKISGGITTDHSNTTWVKWSQTVGIQVSAVPVPPALWLFASGILGIVGVGRRVKDNHPLTTAII